MSPLRGLVHVHTHHSFDSLLSPLAYLAYARRARLDFLCITDHNTLAGSLAAARRNHNPGLDVVIGAEYVTELGDVIGLFLREQVQSRRFTDVVEEIHAQGGLALLPHPYRGHAVDDDLYAAVDLVEVFNARSGGDANAHALADAQRLGKPQVVGADIHTTWELLRNGTLLTLAGDGDLRRRLLHAPRSFGMRRTSLTLRRYSQVIKRVRRRVGFPGRA